MLLEAMEAKVIEGAIDDFYYLSRSAMVKDERHIDKFDRVFGHVFKGLEPVEGEEEVELPEEWLRKMAELYLTEEERQKIESLRRLAKACWKHCKSASKNRKADIRVGANGSEPPVRPRLAHTVTIPKACVLGKANHVTAAR